MTYCTLDELTDLAETLHIIRGWPVIFEVRPAVFEFDSIPFMHFIQNGGRRWVNVRRGLGWGLPLQLPQDMSELDHKRLLREIRARYCVTTLAFSRRAVA